MFILVKNHFQLWAMPYENGRTWVVASKVSGFGCLQLFLYHNAGKRKMSGGV